MALLRFLFGHGWWIAWHVAFHLILLATVVLTLLIIHQDLKPSGAKPDPPSPASIMALMIGLGLVAVTLVDAIFFARTLHASWPLKLAVTLGLPLLVGFCVFPLNLSLATTQSRLIFRVNAAVAAAVALGNLALLWQVEARGV